MKRTSNTNTNVTALANTKLRFEDNTRSLPEFCGSCLTKFNSNDVFCTECGDKRGEAPGVKSTNYRVLQVPSIYILEEEDVFRFKDKKPNNESESKNSVKVSKFDYETMFLPLKAFAIEKYKKIIEGAKDGNREYFTKCFKCGTLEVSADCDVICFYEECENVMCIGCAIKHGFISIDGHPCVFCNKKCYYLHSPGNDGEIEPEKDFTQKERKDELPSPRSPHGYWPASPGYSSPSPPHSPPLYYPASPSYSSPQGTKKENEFGRNSQ